jgi:hypothetical protein
MKRSAAVQRLARPRRSSRVRGAARIFIPFIGLVSLVWFLIRVIPKPSRAAYPCMKAAAPLASQFVLWLAAFPALSVFRGKGPRMAIFAVLAAAVLAWAVLAPIGCAGGGFRNVALESPNRPIGAPVGIFPGRVVWAWNPDATNEKLTNKPGDGWFLPKNNGQPEIDRMLSDAIRALSGKETDASAWEAIFRFHNSRAGGGGYVRGQKIFIKINATSSWFGNFNPADLSVMPNEYYGVAETNPALVLSVLRQLVNTAGAAQEDISIADPMKHIYKHAYDLWHAEFPRVHYLDKDFGGHLGREKLVFTRDPAIFYSDRGTVMRAVAGDDNPWGPPTVSDTLCSEFRTADYVINIPAMKGHKRGGVTMFAKNHFGSNGRDAARHLHDGLVNPTEKNPERQGYGLYRVQVDLMGHEWLGGKNLLYLMDALYAGPEAVYPPTKWRSAPFDNDWTSSIFVSLDPVAIESVGYDFLRTEYTQDTPYTWVQMRGVDDYLHQAADRAAWPAGITYDPENDGTPIGSLGVHEHWNNARDKKYSRDLGTGAGIELVRIGDGN